MDQEEKKVSYQIEEVKPKPNFWQWYFPKRPIFFLRFILFTYFLQWFIWNVSTLIKKENLEKVFFAQETLEGLGGMKIVFGPILGTLFIFVTIIPLIMMWVFYSLSISKWEIKDPALRIWAGIGIILVPFISILFFKLFSLILGISY